MELQLSGKGVIKMKAIQCCYFLALVSSHLMAGVMGDDNIFLSNSDSAALYCVAKIFPDGENILIYKVNIQFLSFYGTNKFLTENTALHYTGLIK